MAELPSSVVSTDLTAEILTQSMPLSDSFNRATSAEVKIGVHHGFDLSFDDATWPHGNFSTQSILVSAGKAVVPAEHSTDKCTDDVFVSVVLDADLSIDLSAITHPIGAADATIYYVVLQVDYTAPITSNLTGLVTNTGANSPKIYISASVAGTGFAGKGIVLGKFCRADKYIEIIGESPIEFSNIAAKNGYGWEANDIARDKNKCLSNFKTNVNINQYANLRKHVTIEGITDLGNTPDNGASVGAVTMPLKDITSTVATAVGDINTWTQPIDWTTNTLANIYGGGTGKPGIWKDVEVFELFNSYFRNDMNIAFHRTSGNGKLYTLSLTNRATAAQIEALNDYGSTRFVFDGKGSVWEGDLVIDLVLDFVGKAEDHIYRISFRNIEVKGSLTINYGQSFLGQAGGAFGKITLDDVHADDGIIVRPWPQIDGIAIGDVVAAGPYIGQTVSWLLNNAQGIDLTAGGYTTTPDSLLYWQVGGATGWTKGVIIPIRLISSRTGGGGVPPAMGAPYLEELADGGVILRKSTVPSTLFGQSLQNCTDTDYKLEIRIQLRECTFYVKQGTSGGYRSIPRIYKTSDVVVTLTDFIAQVWRDIASSNDLQCLTDVNAAASVNAGSNVIAGATVQGDNVVATTAVTAPHVHTSADVVADTNVTAAGTVQGAITKATTYAQAATGMLSGTAAGTGTGLLKWVCYTGNLAGSGNTSVDVSALITDLNMFGLSVILEGTDLVWYTPWNTGAYFSIRFVASTSKVYIEGRNAPVNSTNAYRIIIWYV